MIPYIRSLSELMVITESRDNQMNLPKRNETCSSIEDSGQRKRYIRSLKKEEVHLPDLPQKKRHKWIHNKIDISKFFDNLDYNNKIQSSYDLTLLAKQSKTNQKDVA